MSYLLDTNICSAHLRRPSGLAHRFTQHVGRLSIPTIVLAELYAWAHGRDAPQPVLSSIEDLLEDLDVLVFDRACAREFGRLWGVLRRQGAPTSPVDLMIASVALVHDLTLITHNPAHFQQVPNLRWEDWLEP
jgi:tRNA(fMet)-specific endonuclease VapC